MNQRIIVSGLGTYARAGGIAIYGLMILSFSALAVSMIFPQISHRISEAIAVVAMLLVLLIGAFLGRVSQSELDARKQTIKQARFAQNQMEELFAMTDMLQAADGYDDAAAVLLATGQRLLPEYSGALYVFNNSRDRLDLTAKWNDCEGFTPPETLLPSSCWALKRGKPHINDPATNTLQCMHQTGTAAAVEVPMMARGSVYGLLVLAIEADDAFNRLIEVRRVGRALADSMSLALSNMALREKLRTQSLRDPLTGLHNRRYMEDALDRYISLAERNGSATSVVMIDLDNFKNLNDENGHAKGDAVLCDVAAQLVATLRPSDVVSRYGGEELVVILPNCGIEDAELKAEMLRARIESLSEPHGVPISASLGIASVPETSTGVADVIPMADAALYKAKQAGKNCVCSAKRRAGQENVKPRLATA